MWMLESLKSRLNSHPKSIKESMQISFVIVEVGWSRGETISSVGVAVRGPRARHTGHGGGGSGPTQRHAHMRGVCYSLMEGLKTGWGESANRLWLYMGTKCH
ncbi:unnamed protein product [Cuscuta epithymum]|uniref:Uncharacterized protein n=1 Tax=Cuscuta epithymum TaxID=186058 RepID=A0AAV0FPY6_9ASTE|nr:unnamed protein product [Cuscuta epithymum]